MSTRYRLLIGSVFSTLFLVMALSAHRVAPAPPDEPAHETVVVLELFTSEGCSSCPSADRLLSELASNRDGVRVVPLSLHVDYWDHLGWKDRFSSRRFSERQRRYARARGSGRVYTPQLIVHGVTELVGSDRRGAQRAIARATSVEKTRIALEILSKNDREIVLRVDGELRRERSPADRVLTLAVTEDGLSTRVEWGENAGRRLDHVSVVRRLRELPVAEDGSSFSRTVTLPLLPGWNMERLRVVAFLQEWESRRIVGATSRALGPRS